jgi:hypothetical protein
MKKYLLGFAAVVFAVAFSAFTKPESANRTTFYSFKYLAPGGSFSIADVQNLAVTSWGNAVPAPGGNPVQNCPQLVKDEKACEIVVVEAETILVGGVRRLRLPGNPEFGTVTIAAIDGDASAHTGVYMVDPVNSVSISTPINKDF